MFKLVINHKGKAFSKELNENESHVFLGKKIGDDVSGNTFGFKNYEFKITGGSDKDGFPMRFDLPGAVRKKIFLSKGPCVKIETRGARKRKMVRGNTISESIKQININILKEGEKKVDEIFGKKEEAKEENN